MNRREKMNDILKKVSEERKDELIKEYREAETKEAKKKVLEKFGIVITEEEANEFLTEANELSDDEMDKIGGGCCSHMSCSCA